MRILYDEFGRGVDFEETEEEHNLFGIFLWDYIEAYLRQDKNIKLSQVKTYMKKEIVDETLARKIQNIMDICGQKALQDLVLWCKENRKIADEDFRFLSRGVLDLRTIKD